MRGKSNILELRREGRFVFRRALSIKKGAGQGQVVAKL